LAQYEQALRLYHTALAISREIKDRYTTAWTLYRFGLAYAAQEQFALAEQALKEAVALFEAIGISRGMEACRELLTQLPIGVSQIAESREDSPADNGDKPKNEKE
ncbi:MAG: tetratricopeptide repeat protein, partial [Anaerolineae bacterium]